MKFISTRCSNINHGDPAESRPKKIKLEKTVKHAYPSIFICDEVTIET